MKLDAQGRFTFRFNAWTPHATRYFRFYITRDGWKPAMKLRWSDLEQFAGVRDVEAVNGYYEMNVKMPKDKTGRRLIYVVWQRSDSMEAFYSCSDVKIPKARKASAAAIDWEEAGRAVARNDLPEGTTVAFRVFDAKGGDVARIPVRLTAATGAAAHWPELLARKVNATSDVFRIGVMDDDDDTVITPERSSHGNIVYRSDRFAGYSYAIDVDTP